MLRVHGLQKISEVNGPGRRSVIWVQGCRQRCPGCFNPGTFDPDLGAEMSVDDLAAWLPLGEIEGVTFSGGEPFLQPGPLADLAERCAALGLTVLCFTGYRYDEALGGLREVRTPEAGRLLSLVDILIDGPYLRDCPPVHPWTGSGNQRVLTLKKAGPVLTDGPGRYEEITISATGEITITGF